MATTEDITTIINSTLAEFPDTSDSSSVSSLRRQAKNSLLQVGLPGVKHEEYRHTPFLRALEKNIDFSTAAVEGDSIENIDEFLIEGLETSLIVFLNGVYSKSLSSTDDDVTVVPLQEALTTHRDVVDTHLGQYADLQDTFTAWNTAAWLSGVLIEAKDNTQVKKPVLLLYIYDTRAGQRYSFVRNLVILGKESTLEIIEKVDAIGTAPFFSSIVNEGEVKQNGRLIFTNIQNTNGRHLHYGHTAISQQDDSHVECNTYTLNGEFIRNNLRVAIDGNHCEGHMYGLYLLKGKTFTDNHTVMDHRKPESFSNEMYRGVLDDQSRAVFNGKIFVRPNAQKTNAFQANRNILLTDEVVVHTKPQLEIWADDVKCSHGCTTGQIDTEALFYLRTRGIPEETARGMLLYAFVYETFGHLKNIPLREYINKIVNERLHRNI